jgi:antitoxin PrlF
MTTTKITAKGQVTIPVEIRRKLGLNPGDRVTFRDSDDGIVIEPTRKAVHRLAGMLREYAENRPPATIDDLKEAAAAGWAREPLKQDQ